MSSGSAAEASQRLGDGVPVDLAKARKAAQRLVDVAFRNRDKETGELVRAHFEIPAHRDDDDIILTRALDELERLRSAEASPLYDYGPMTEAYRQAQLRRESAPARAGSDDNQGGANMRAAGEKPDPVGHKGMAGERSDDTDSNEGGAARSRGRAPGSTSSPNASPAEPMVTDLGCWVCRVLADAVKANAVDLAMYEGMIVGARIGLGAPPVLCAEHAARWDRVGMQAGLAEVFREATAARAADSSGSAQDEHCRVRPCACPCHTDVEEPGPHLITCAWAKDSYVPDQWCAGAEECIRHLTEHSRSPALVRPMVLELLRIVRESAAAGASLR